MLEFLLLTSLILLLIVSVQSSERYIKNVFIISGILVAIFAVNLWFDHYRHFSIFFSALSAASIGIGFFSNPGKRLLKIGIGIWLFFLMTSVWYLNLFDRPISPGKPPMLFAGIHLLDSIQDKHSDTHLFWPLFFLFFVFITWLLPHRKRTIGICILIFWLIACTDPIFSNKKYAHIYWGGVIDEVSRNWVWGTGVDARNNYKETRLFIAAKKGDIVQVKKLLDQGASINDQGTTVHGGICTPLDAAIRHNSYGVFLLLVTNGVDTNKANKEGWYPIHHASAARVTDMRIIEYLVNHGADVNIPVESKYVTYPLHEAVRMVCNSKIKECNASNEKLIKFIIGHGANLEMRNWKGYTPLIEATRESNFEAVKLLVELGADINAQDKRGETALKKAIESKENLETDKKLNEKSKDRLERYQKIVSFLEPLTKDIKEP
jgi:ankyrin repeat protein